MFSGSNWLMGILPRVHLSSCSSKLMFNYTHVGQLCNSPERSWGSLPWQPKINGVFTLSWWMTRVQICQHRIIHTQHSLSPYLTHTDTEHFNRGVSLTVFLWNKQIREISEQTMMTYELTQGYTHDSHSRILSTVYFKTQVSILGNTLV